MRHDLRVARLRVGRNVRALRRLRGLSQEGLAEIVGNSHKHIGQVERGEVNVTLDVLSGIAAALSVTISDLFGPPAEDMVLLTPAEAEQVQQALRLLDRGGRRHRGRGRESSPDTR